MTIFGRKRCVPSSKKPTAGQKLRRKEFQRRALWGEALEARVVMDGAAMPFVSHPFWNINQPIDVNNDGMITAFDALRIINDLNNNGARSLATAGTSAGEGPETQGYLDVNNDNFVSALDALQVINRLNNPSSAGEGEPMIRMTVQIVAAGTNNDLETISKGDFYEVRVLAEDLGVLTYLGQNRSPDNTGVITTFFDLLYDKSKTDFQTNESQIVVIGGSPTTNGTFTLTVNDGGTLKTTAPITFASNRTVTRDNIEAALNNLLKPTPTSPKVVEVSHEPSGTNNRWRVRFLNRLSNQDVPEMTGSVAGLGAATISITELIKGTVNAASVDDALRIRPFYDSDGNLLNSDPAFYQDQRNGNIETFGINDVGGSNFQAPYPGLFATEIVRLRMTAEDAGLVNIDLSYLDVNNALPTGLVGFNNAVPTSPLAGLVIVVNDSITIVEPLSAIDDTVNLIENDTAPVDINVTANDVNNPPTPNTPKTVVSVDTTGTVGTVQILNASTIRYTPPGTDFNGATTFTYTVVDQNGNSDTATVTINFAPVNDAPVINGPGPQTFNEDTTRVFSQLNGNQITITDVDAGAGLVTMTLSVGAGNGNLSLASTAGLTGLTNNASTISATGTLGDLNLALDGLSYTPTLNLNGLVTLTVTANDNGNTGGAPLQTSLNIPLNLTAVNDAPVVELGGFTITPDVIEGDPLVLNAANNTLIQVSDVDAGTNPVVVTLAVTAGNVVQVNPTAGVLIGANGTNNVTLTGTLAAINTALNGITYIPSSTFGGNNESLLITINDQGNTGAVNNPLSDSESVTIIVDTSVRPRARNDVMTVAEDSVAGVANTKDVLINDIPNTGGSPTLVSFQTTTSNGGTITRDEGGTPGDLTDDKLIYVPAPDFFGIDSFTYTMNDTTGLGLDAIGTVTVTVTAVNDPPVAVNDTLTNVAEDSGARTILAATLTANDSPGPANESAQTLEIISVGNAVGGTVALVGGNVVFTPTPDYAGPASFTYTVRDNGQTNGVNDFLTSNAATASFTITEVNDAPVAPALVLSAIDEDSGNRTISFATLLAGATPGGGVDEAGQTLVITQATSGNGGTVSIVGTDVIFVPQANFNGLATFTVAIQDNGTTNGVAAPATTVRSISFTVIAVNDAPTAVDDAATTGENQSMVIAVRANDFDVDVPPFTGTPGQLEVNTTIVNISSPMSGGNVVGTAVPQGTGILFTPNVGFFGTATFTYQLNDGSGAANNLSNIATVTVTVVEANDPPVANDDPGIIADEDLTVSIDVFANDTDPDTDPSLWSFVLVTPPAHGTAVFNTTTRLVDYTPAANYNGPDSFVYRINDNSPINPQNLFSNNALVSITVREVNDPPVGGVDPATGEFTVIMDDNITFTAAQLLANDSPGPANESGQTLSITGVTAGTANGTVTLNAGVITYTPAIGFTGLDYFEYTLTDNGTTAGVADPKSAQVRVNLIVRDFVPTDVIGRVFRDVNANGTFEANIDFPLSGVEITLSGTSLISGVFAPLTIQTNANGFYQFLGVEPGTYTLHETQPFGLADGIDTAGLFGSLTANDTIELILPLINESGNVSVNNFAEGALSNAGLINSAGMMVELTGSSSPNGFVLGSDLDGNTLWSWALKNWEGALSVSVDLNDADLSMATLTVTDANGSHTIDIFQNPHDTRNSPTVRATLARFRILGWDAHGNYLIRIDGKASDFFGAPLAAAPVMAGGEYIDGVDAAMEEESWF